MEKLALYFGCADQSGHFLHGLPRRGSTLNPGEETDMPWTIGHLDTGLLANGKVPDEVTGRVYWTCGGVKSYWYAFFWWDRSGDKRGASNSGFYVRGFERNQVEAAFAFACSKWPKIVERQKKPLYLDNVPTTQLMDEATDLATKLATLLKVNEARMNDAQRSLVFALATGEWCATCGSTECVGVHNAG